MDHLTFIVHNITPQVRSALIKKIGGQQKKLQLFKILEQEGEASNQWLNNMLGYPPGNYTNLYTLKNRLFDDIAEVVTELAKNNVVITKEKVQSLRVLLYSRDKLSLLRELKRQEKNALQVELFNELKEIYFCFFLTFRNNPKKAKKYAALMDEYDEKQGHMHLLERIFYSELQETQDLFYSMNANIYQRALPSLDLMHRLHVELRTKSSEFLYLSARLTLMLTSLANIADAASVKSELHTLSALYTDPTVAYKYPNYHLSIQGLYSRYYFLTQQDSEFYQMQKAIRKELSKAKGYQLFDHNYFYFVYVSLVNNVRLGDPESNLDLLVEILPEAEVDVQDNKMKVYILHLHALRLLLQGKYHICADQLMEMRKYFSDLPEVAGWVVIDNILLHIIVCLVTEEAELVEPEIYLLKRKIRKLGLDQQYTYHLRNFVQEVRLYKRHRDHHRISEYFKGLQEHLGVLPVVLFDEQVFTGEEIKKGMKQTAEN